MITEKQRKAAKKNVKKAQEKWKDMSKTERSRSQPSGRARKKPGAGGEGDYYHVEVRDKNQFTSFRTQDIGREGHTQRVAGHRKSGSWDTQKWLIHKDDAHVEGDTLVTDDEDVQNVLDQLGSEPKHVKGDIFEAKPRPNISEKEKPTKAQQEAREENIKKAQEAWQEMTPKERREARE